MCALSISAPQTLLLTRFMNMSGGPERLIHVYQKIHTETCVVILHFQVRF
jgi:hypothetical protein